MWWIVDLRLGFRSAARRPGYFLLSLFTLALGVGIATVMFSVTESVLWKPLPLPDSERLVAITEYNPKTHPNDSSASTANFLEWRARARSFEGLAALAWSGRSHTLTGAGERVRSGSVSAGAFETLGVRLALGRGFTRQEENSSSRVAILSHDFWRSHFGGSANAIGQTFQLDRQPYTVIGVLPDSFRLEQVLGMAEPDLLDRKSVV